MPPKPTIRRVFINNLKLDMSIGIYDFEKAAKQAVQISMDIFIPETGLGSGDGLNEDINNVVCYEKMVNGIKKIIEQKHFNLVETLAEEIAQMGLQDPRVSHLRVKVEKLDIFKDVHSVGVEIERHQIS